MKKLIILACALAICGTAAADPITLYWTVKRDTVIGGFEYDFSLKVEEAIPAGSMLDWITFFDRQSAGSLVNNPTLVGPAPPPYTQLSSSAGFHNGPTFINVPNPGWQPVNIGDSLDWKIHADNDVPNILWSNLLGTQTFGNFTPAVELDRLILTVDPLVAGQSATFSVTDAQPGGSVYFVYGTNGLWDTFINQLNVFLDINNPILLARVTANNAGEASVTRNIPNAVSGLNVWIQAAEQDKTSRYYFQHID